MIRILLTVIAFLTACFTFKSYAQVNDINPAAGDVSTHEYANLVFADSGSIGPDQVWDFSGLTGTGELYTRSFRELTTQEQADVPGANIAYTENDEPDVYFMYCSADSLAEFGSAASLFENPMVLYSYPITVSGYAFTDAASIYMPGVVEINVATQGWSQGAGTLITPAGVFENVIKVRKRAVTDMEAMGETEQIIINTFTWLNAENKNEILVIEDVDYVNDTEADYTESRFLKNAHVTGIATLAADAFSLYPNPASETIYIRHTTQAPEAYAIYSIAGILVQSGGYSNGIDVSTLPAGEYVIRATHAQGAAHLKFAKL